MPAWAALRPNDGLRDEGNAAAQATRMRCYFCPAGGGAEALAGFADLGFGEAVRRLITSGGMTARGTRGVFQSGRAAGTVFGSRTATGAAAAAFATAPLAGAMASTDDGAGGAAFGATGFTATTRVTTCSRTNSSLSGNHMLFGSARLARSAKARLKPNPCSLRSSFAIAMPRSAAVMPRNAGW